MPGLITVYETATGKPVYEGFADDPSREAPGNSVLETEIPEFQPGQVLPWSGVDQAWMVDGERVLRSDYVEAGLESAGLGVTLSLGHVFGERMGQVLDEDFHTFDSPAEDLGIALDVVEADGVVQLAAYTWDPESESKGDPPDGAVVIKADLLRGVLPAGAASLAELEEE